MKVKDYKGIVDYIEKKVDKQNVMTEDEKISILKGITICKAKNCNQSLYKNQSSTNRQYCSDCA